MAHPDLETLSQLYGVETTYVDTWQKPRTASPEALLRVCRLLGAEVETPADVPNAVRERRQYLWRSLTEPVSVAWDGVPGSILLRLSQKELTSSYECRISFEGGAGTTLSGRVDDLPTVRQEDVDGVHCVEKRLDVPGELPQGYHRLIVDVSGRQAECLIISAPSQAYCEGNERVWGPFLPLYALHRKGSAQAGNLSDLGELMEWTAARGGNFVATLPLLAILWEFGEGPSPYQPGSRLFWNEFYIDLQQIPEFKDAGDGLLPMQPPAAAGANECLIDYPAQMTWKRRVLESLATSFFASSGSRRDELAEYCRMHPELEQFARFRATGEHQRRPWFQWPDRLRQGELRPEDYDPAVYQYHLYAQWQVNRQLDAVAERARRLNLLWYLDFPLGISGAGYDIWREQDLFVSDAAGGAPPDNFFTKGQNWGFHPLHPQQMRRQGYRYFINSLRAHLEHARILRFDHVMGLYRLYWVPEGFSADTGAYVRYPMEELFAILCLESHRYSARIVGENLGTVPVEVDQALSRHTIDGMYVLQFATHAEEYKPAIEPVPASVAASLNTHDTPPFAAFWEGTDIEDRLDAGLLSADEADQEANGRARTRTRLVQFLRDMNLIENDAPSTADVLRGCLAFLARSDARFVLVNLEDLWGEHRPQNHPGTHRERPNWKRKTKYPLEEFRELPEVTAALSLVDKLRA